MRRLAFGLLTFSLGTLLIPVACASPPPQPPTYPPMRPPNTPYREPPTVPPSDPPAPPTPAPDEPRPPPQPPAEPGEMTPPAAEDLEPEESPPERFPPPATMPPDAWSLDAEELRALDGYRSFSADGLLFAYVEPIGPEQTPTLFLVATPTETIESTQLLTEPEARRQAAIELSEEGFPRPGADPPIPAPLGVHVDDEDRIQLTFGGAPAAQPIRPFEHLPGAVPIDARIVAVSRDGLLVAVRVTGHARDLDAPFEYRLVRLFE